MSNERSRDRGNLFENTEKKKPSQPDLQGDCTIDGASYEIRGFKRGEELELHLAPPRGDRNTYPPDVFRGSLEAGPPPPRPAKGGRGAAASAAPAAPRLAWTGDIVSDEAAYKMFAHEKQGKSGLYFTLSFEKLAERPAAADEYVDPDADADAAEHAD